MSAAVLIAAPASGQGKTTVAAALARLHARRGASVRCFKCGPDFLDPMWLQLASGHPVDALDLWINGEVDCARRLGAAAAEADLLIVEGVMGLFDGAPSAADLARRFGLPVLAVIDAGAMAETFGAVAHGLRTWRPGLSWAGVLANRVGSERHAQMLRESLVEADDWQGHLPHNAAMALPERHLGLTMPQESAAALARLDAAADALASTPLGRRSIADWPRWAAPVAPLPPPPPPALTERLDAPAAGRARQVRLAASGPPAQPDPLWTARRIAYACDPAFAFVYPANLQVLRGLGAQLLPFSPLAGDGLPPCDALWLPGGYPELHAARLAGCVDLRDQIAEHLAAGRPLWAECGGMMVLAEHLSDATGQRHKLWGLLPGSVVLGRRLAALGPHSLTLDAAAEDGALRGHSFHWSHFETGLAPSLHTVPAGTVVGRGEPVYQLGGLRASWFHPWFASSPRMAARLFADAALVVP